MKKLIKFILTSMGLLIFLYLIWVFVNLKPNPDNWGEEGRGMFIIAWLFSNGIAALAYATFKSE